MIDATFPGLKKKTMMKTPRAAQVLPAGFRRPQPLGLPRRCARMRRRKLGCRDHGQSSLDVQLHIDGAAGAEKDLLIKSEVETAISSLQAIFTKHQQAKK